MSHVNHKLSGSLEGALAGGGDPATSPLYVFGPFLKLIVAAGLGSVVMGAAVWLAVLTVVVVGLVYRRVMTWITDGSGGSGLCEDEFGTWAVILNAGITVIEYTLTFLVSVAALVTFLADRFVVLKQSLLGVPAGLLVALGITVAIGFAVNLGPKVAARTFGPATAAVLLLLLTFALIYKVIPNIDQPFRFVTAGSVIAVVAWILRDQLGRELARIGRDEPRQVEYLTQKVWSFGQSVKRWTRSYARIRTAQRVWETCRSIPKETRPAVERLLRPPFRAHSR